MTSRRRLETTSGSVDPWLIDSGSPYKMAVEQLWRQNQKFEKSPSLSSDFLAKLWETLTPKCLSSNCRAVGVCFLFKTNNFYCQCVNVKAINDNQWSLWFHPILKFKYSNLNQRYSDKSHYVRQCEGFIIESIIFLPKLSRKLRSLPLFFGRRGIGIHNVITKIYHRNVITLI